MSCEGMKPARRVQEAPVRQPQHPAIDQQYPNEGSQHDPHEPCIAAGRGLECAIEQVEEYAEARLSGRHRTSAATPPKRPPARPAARSGGMPRAWLKSTTSEATDRPATTCVLCELAMR